MNLLEKKAFVEANLHVVPQNELESFLFNFACVYTKNSTCMEGPDLVTVEEVVSIIKGHQVKVDEVLKRSVYNHYKAYHHMLDVLKDTKEIKEEVVKDLHEILLNGIADGGLYRNMNIRISGSAYVPCDYIKVYDRMKKYFRDMNSNEPIVSSSGAVYKTDLEVASYAHLQLAKIHPFLDGNGRLARLVLNYVLISKGYLPIVIPVKRKNEYFDCLEKFKVNKDAKPFEDFLEDLLILEYNRLILLIKRYQNN